MRVNEVVEITKGTLLNTPHISMFSRIICHIEQVEKGDLFVIQRADSRHIARAVEAGAYGILCEEKMDINDEDVAYIVVENVQESLMRLIRYHLLARDIAIISLTPIEISIARSVVNDETVGICDENLMQFIELLNDERLALVLTCNTQILEIGFNVVNADKPKDKPFLVLSHTLFDSTILYNGVHYRINLPKLFFNELSTVLMVCETHKIKYSLEHFKHIPFFKPNFLNSFGDIIDYGQASKVAIAEEDIERFKRYMAYIANNATWGKTLFIVPHLYFELFNQITKTFAYNTQEELCEHIYRENFNFALILGINDDTLVYALNTNRKQVLEPDLFSSLCDD